MAHDAIERSLSEHEPALDQQIRELRDYLSVLKQQLEDAISRFEARAEWGNDFSRDLNERIEANRNAITETRRLLEIISQPQAAAASAGGRHAAKPQRDRSHLRIVHGGAAAIAAACAIARWTGRSAAHKAIGIATLAAVGTGASVAAPSLILGHTPAGAGVITGPSHHRRHLHLIPLPAGMITPPLAGHARKRRARDDDDASRASEVQPTPSPSPTGAPTPTVSPTPTAIPTPVPSPSISGGVCEVIPGCFASFLWQP